MSKPTIWEVDRDIEWQEHLAHLHEGFSGDGCESGDARDWTAAAIAMRINRMQDLMDDLVDALSALIEKNEVYEYEGRISANVTFSVDDLNAARDALKAARGQS